MFYKSLKKRVFLITFFLLFIFLMFSFTFQMFLIPQFSEYNLKDEINVLKGQIIDEANTASSEDEMIEYLSELSASNNTYISLYETGTDNLVWSFINEESFKDLGTENSSLATLFPIETSFGDYDVNITSSFKFNAYIQEAITSLLSFSFFLGVIFLLFIVLILIQLIANPVVSINNKLTKMLNGTYVRGKNMQTREDEIGEINDKIEVLYKKYLDKELELKGDENLQKEQESLRREHLAIISHELKTPLTVLKLQTECMEANIGDYKDHSKYLKENLKILENMESLVYSILNSLEVDQRDIKKSKKPIKINELIKEQIADMRILWENKNLRFAFDMKEVSKNIDYDMMKKALKNIIENAIKYSEDSGKITIILDDDHLSIININKDVTNKDLKGVFKAFARADKSRNTKTGGSGIGLYVVGEVLKKHNYHYSIEKIRDKVIFTIEFR